MKGGGDGPKEIKKVNFYATFGCAPSLGVPAASHVVDRYTKCLDNYLIENGGVL